MEEKYFIGSLLFTRHILGALLILYFNLPKIYLKTEINLSTNEKNTVLIHIIFAKLIGCPGEMMFKNTTGMNISFMKSVIWSVHHLNAQSLNNTYNRYSINID
jgi:hypothetical protein